MIDATISRVRLRGLARLGRCRGWPARYAGPPAPCASGAGHLTDATSIAEPPSPPRSERSRGINHLDARRAGRAAARKPARVVVCGDESRDLYGAREAVGDAHRSSLAEPPPELGVPEKRGQRLAEGTAVAGRHEQPRDAVLDGIDEPADCGRDDGRPWAIASRATMP